MALCTKRMDLSEFIKETLVQLAKGIRESQQEVRNHTGIASPAFRTKPRADTDELIGITTDGRQVYFIDFDISIEITEGEETDSSGKLRIGIASVGRDNQKSMANNRTSRIKFRVPYSPPLDPETHEDLKAANEARKVASQAVVPRRGSHWDDRV